MRCATTKALGTLDTRATAAVGLERSNIWRTVPDAYGGVEGDRTVVEHELVEVAEVVLHLLVGDGRIAWQHPCGLDEATEVRDVALDAHRHDQVGEQLDLVAV